MFPAGEEQIFIKNYPLLTCLVTNSQKDKFKWFILISWLAPWPQGLSHNVGGICQKYSQTNCCCLRQWHPTPVLLPGKSHGLLLRAWWAAVHGVAKSRTQPSDFTFTFHFHALEKEMATNSSVLAWRIPGTGEPGGLPSTGSHRVGHDWSDLAATAANP